MANKHILPLSGTTSDGLVVCINEVESGFLTQLAGWGSFREAADEALRAREIAFSDDYQTPARSGNTTVWWVAPDRVLIRSEKPLGIESSSDLVALNLSDARIAVTVEGLGAAGLLSRVVALDFTECAFPVGSFVQTSLHHVGVLIDRHGSDRFTIFIPTTWAKSLIGLLADHLSNAA
ncbi:hypothetical protein AAIB41_17800 [Brucella sp. BE17]|uniref:hypothetical protein n=1 Tax=Brucella sp. BE17 TaxID=3142977 RepID=UPI0031BAD257